MRGETRVNFPDRTVHTNRPLETTMTRNQPSLKHTQLRRNPRRKRIGGVCAGLSDYLGIDVILVRLIFMLSLLFGGLGMALYLVLWIVIPAASPTLMPKVSPRLEKTLRRVDKQVQCLNRRHQPEVADRAQEMLDTITLLAPPCVSTMHWTLTH